MSNKLKAVSFNEHDAEHMLAYKKSENISNFSQFVRDCLHGLVESDSSNFRSTRLIEMKIADLTLKLNDKNLDRTTHWRVQKKIEALERLKNISTTDYVSLESEDNQSSQNKKDARSYSKKTNEKIKSQINWYKSALEKMEKGEIKKSNKKIIEYNSAIDVLNWVLPESERIKKKIEQLEQSNEND